MPKILFRAFHITDLHLNPLDRIPQSRTETYHDDVLFEWDAYAKIIEEARAEGPVPVTVVSGDLFNLKNQKAYSPNDSNYYRAQFIKIGDTYTIPGNHDLPKSAYSQVEKTAYQNLVNSTPTVHDVSYQIVEVAKVEGIPVRICGVPYLPLTDLLTFLPEFDRQLQAAGPGINIVLLHPDAMPQTDLPLHFDVCSWQDLLINLPHATVICLGHIHASYPILQQASPTGRPQFICKPWSAARIVKDYHVSADFLEHHHRPMYTDIRVVLTDAGTVSIECEYRAIPYVPFDRAFLPETLRREIENSGKIQSFLGNLREVHGTVEAAFTLDSPEDFMAKANIPDEVREILDRYLNA